MGNRYIKTCIWPNARPAIEGFIDFLTDNGYRIYRYKDTGNIPCINCKEPINREKYRRKIWCVKCQKVRRRFYNSRWYRQHKQELHNNPGTYLGNPKEKNGHIESWVILQRLMASGRFKEINGQYRSE